MHQANTTKNDKRSIQYLHTAKILINRWYLLQLCMDSLSTIIPRISSQPSTITEYWPFELDYRPLAWADHLWLGGTSYSTVDGLGGPTILPWTVRGDHFWGDHLLYDSTTTVQTFDVIINMVVVLCLLICVSTIDFKTLSVVDHGT